MDYQKEYEYLEEKKDAVNIRINKVKQKYANENCPYKFGDTVKILGYPHTGKNGIIKKISGTTGLVEEKLIWKI